MSHPGRVLLSACLAAACLSSCRGDESAAVQQLEQIDGVSRVALRHDAATSRSYALVVPAPALDQARLSTLLNAVNDELHTAENAPDRIMLAAPGERDSLLSVEVSEKPLPESALGPWLRSVETMSGPAVVKWRPEDASLTVSPSADLPRDLKAASRLRQDSFTQWEFDPSRSTDDGVTVTGEFSPVLALYLADFAQQSQQGPDPVELRMVVEPDKTDLIATLNLGLEAGAPVPVATYADRLRPLAMAARAFYAGTKVDGALVVHTGASFLGTSEPAASGDPQEDWSAWLQQMVRGKNLSELSEPAL